MDRRHLLKGAACAAGAGLLRKLPFADIIEARAARPATKVAFAVPQGACDCHVHVFGDPQKYPFFAGRTYTPDAATAEELKPVLDALHMDRVIVVQPSVYGTDNRCAADAVRFFGNRARGVAVVDANTPDAEIDRLAQAGFRGTRINLAQAGVNDPAAAAKAFQTAAARAKAHGWHVQIYTSPRVILALKPALIDSPVPVVFDHFGGAKADAGLDQPGFSTLVDLVKSGKAYVKISGAADSVSTKAPDYSDVTPFAKALVAANTDRVLWGSSWPHPGSGGQPNRKPTDLSPNGNTDDGLVLNLLPAWVPDAATRRKILVDNPARLYGF